MPYVSKAQQGLFHSPNSPVGPKEVAKWDRESKGVRGLPKHVPKRAGDPPGADLTMRPAVAPAVNIAAILGKGGGTAPRGAGVGAAKYPKAVKMPALSMAKPKGAKGLGKMGPAAPAGTRMMDRGFGAMMPREAKDEGNPYTMIGGGF